MTLLVKPTHSRYQNGEYIQLMIGVIGVFKNEDPQRLSLNDLVEKLITEVNVLNDGFMESKGETMRAALMPLDERRISSARGLRLYLQSETLNPVSDRQKAAEALYKSYLQYCDGLSKMTLPNKTAVVNRMLQEWSSNPVLAEAVKTSGAVQWVETLTRENELFSQNYFTKSKAKTRDKKTKDARVAVKLAYEELVTITEAYAKVAADTGPYRNLIRELNSVISNNNNQVDHRGYGRKKKSDKPADPMPTRDPGI